MDEQQMQVKALRARKSYYAKQRARSTEEISVGLFEERWVQTSAGDTRILIYAPTQRKDKAYPIFVNIHGGGFILGSAEDDDIWCRKISTAVDCVVVNIDYCLSPEHKFPEALEECYDILSWLYENARELGLDRERLAVGGHSAGGNLTAALCLLARERRDFSILFQVLDYPPLDLVIDPFTKNNVPQNIILPPKTAAFFTACYFNRTEDALNPLASPALAENLTGLPAALVITAEFDPLREEGEAYAKRLAAAGVPVLYKNYAGCGHAFTHFGPQEAADNAWELIYTQLRQAFSSKTAG